MAWRMRQGGRGVAGLCQWWSIHFVQWGWPAGPVSESQGRGCAMRSMMKLAMAGAQQAGRGFSRPDDDWLPMLLMRNRDGQVSLSAVPVWDDKDAAAALVGAVVASAEAVEVALVLSAWMRVGGPSAAEDGIRPSDHPERREVVTIAWVNHEEAALAIAEIHRRKNRPPTLGEFDISEEAVADGRFLDALRCGVEATVAATRGGARA